MLPMDAAARAAAAKARQRLSESQGGFSDHLAMVAAFREWDMQGSPGRAAAYARANFVSAATMAMVSGMRKQVLQELQVRVTCRPRGSRVLAVLACTGDAPCLAAAVSFKLHLRRYSSHVHACSTVSTGCSRCR